VDESYHDIYDTKFAMHKQTPTDLSRAVGFLRGKKLNKPDEAVAILRGHEDVKGRFWYRSKDFKFKAEHQEAIRELLPST
jgi:hypothetical protein